MFSVLHQLQDYFADEVGVLSPNQIQVDELYAVSAVLFQHMLIGKLKAFVNGRIFLAFPCSSFGRR
jgi:hypothetical protein